MSNYILLIRNNNYGQLFFGNELICFSLDPHKLTSGTYTLELDYSPKFKTILPHIYNDEIEASRGFRIHPGNTLKDSNGCILVGDMIDYKFKLYNSKKALNRLLQIIRDNEICQIVIV